MARVCRAAALVVVLSLLAPLSLPAFQNRADTCGMSCCRKSGVCCCRKARPAQTGGPQWQPVSGCSRNCALRLALPASLSAILPDAGAASGPAFVVTSVAPARPLVREGATRCFALYQRPPPAV